MSDKSLFEFDEKQLKEAIKTLEGLGPTIGQKAWKATIRKQINNVKNSMSQKITALAKNPTPNLSESFKIKVNAKREPYFWKSSVAVDTSKTREQVQAGPTKSAYYYRMVEYGHRLFVGGKDTGRSVPPMGYIEKTKNELGPGIFKELAEGAKIQAEKEIRKINKKRLK